MRKSAQIVSSVLSLGVLALSYKAGIDQAALAGTSNSFSSGTLTQTSSFVKTTPTAPKVTPVVKTATGPVVSFNAGPARGVMQVKATKTDGKLTAVTLVQSSANGGRASAFPFLVKYALQYQGANFGNLGGATYTTNAFKQSLAGALAKI